MRLVRVAEVLDDVHDRVPAVEECYGAAGALDLQNRRARQTGGTLNPPLHRSQRHVRDAAPHCCFGDRITPHESFAHQPANEDVSVVERRQLPG